MATVTTPRETAVGIEIATTLRQRADAYRNLADGAHALVAGAYRRRADQLDRAADLVAAVGAGSAAA